MAQPGAWTKPGSWSSLLQTEEEEEEARAAANTSWAQDVEPGASGREQLVLEIVMVLMCVCAVAGNSLVIVIVAATKTFHSVTSVLIMNLAVSDLLVGLGVMPFLALSVMNRDWADCTGLCLYVGYTSSVYCTASVLSLAAIALDRYHAILHCLHYSSRCTPWRTAAVVLWIWLQALASSCPPLLGWGCISYVTPMYSCAVNWAASPSYAAFMAALSYLIPAVVILFCYVNIVRVARSHARRIHSLEDSVQRSRSPPLGVSPEPQCGPTTLIYHVSGRFVSELSTEERGYPQPTPRRLLPFRAQGIAQPPGLSSQHGVVRLFLVMSAFFLCWTPYISMALVQATEAAISGRSSLVPPYATTFSYWLLLLNSDINPLLYALLSKRFQGALQGLRQKLRARLGSVVGEAGGPGAEGEEGRGSDPCTLTATHPGSSSDTSACEDATDLKYNSEDVCKGCERESAPMDRMDCLHVPCRPQEGSRLPFSALTTERQATFFYGQITVRVEHDVC